MHLAAPATWRRWPTACPTPSPPRSPIPTGQCVAFVGDGGFSMLMAEFATCREVQAADQGRRHQEQHARPDQVGADGVPRQPGVRRASCSRSTSRRSRGPAAAPASPSTTRRVRHGRSTRRWRTPGPVLVEAVVDPYEPPMPPKITAEQALHFAESLARGTPAAGEIALNGVPRQDPRASLTPCVPLEIHCAFPACRV